MVLHARLALERARRVDRPRAHLLDGPGKGQTFEWSLAAGLRADVPLVVAGGLTPENVGAAIEATRPFAVDVASGVESSPGVKDPEKVTAFVRAAEGALV